MPSGEQIKSYVSTLRPHYWARNFLIFVGSAAAWFFLGREMNPRVILPLALALMVSCMVSAVNYIINEILDAPFDARHPTKKFRAIPQDLVSIPVLIGLGALLLVASVTLSWLFINIPTTVAFIGFFGAGILYNVAPFRLKDIPFLDVVSESVNNPIRFLIGWYAFGATFFPPVLLLICFWTFGAMLMSARRLGEKNVLASHDARGYRPTFAIYNSRSLQTQYALYALISVMFFLWLSIVYHKTLLLFLPILLAFIIWLFRMSAHMVPGEIKGNSQYYRGFLPFTVFMFITFFILFLWD